MARSLTPQLAVDTCARWATSRIVTLATCPPIVAAPFRSVPAIMSDHVSPGGRCTADIAPTRRPPAET